MSAPVGKLFIAVVLLLTVTVIDAKELVLSVILVVLVAISAAIDWLTLVKAPEISDAIWAEEDSIPLPEIKPCHEPEISDAIWDEPLNPPLNVPINEFAIILVLELISPVVPYDNSPP